MVIKADGTKWACQSCLKGHRVSGCTHTDRELTLVPKKGRPVTQCQHCRSERKKRSAHVSCECGEGSDKAHHSKEKCIHLREAEGRVRSGSQDECVHDKHALAAVAEEQGCCCPHGGKCTCALTKKHVDSDGDVTPPRGPAVKPRLETTKSDGSITVFQNGHHKPVHRKNHLAHECGMPYKVPMSRAKTDHGVVAKARRSVDSLALDNNMDATPSAFMPQTSAPFNTERRMSKSEQHSPKIFPKDPSYLGFSNADLASIDFSTLRPVQTNQSIQSLSNDMYNFTPIEPLSAVADSAFDPWSSMPSADSAIMPDNNPFGVWPTNPDVNGLAQPALTAASSGTQSEIDEIPIDEEAFTFGMPSIQEDAGAFNFDTVSDLPGTPNYNRRSLPPNFLKNITPSPDWPFDLNTTSNQDFTSNTEDATFDDAWEGSNLPSITDAPKRHTHGLPNVGRPASRSIGPGHAPADDIIKSLFPDMDFDGSYFNTTSLAQDFGLNDVQVNEIGNNSQMSFGPMNEDMELTSQSWADGSMTIPNDEYTSPYDLNQDFSNPGFDGNWSQ
ncbi:hypothetical protein LTR86_000100 [Recurvomyces mirabilis]|nr:hypothetical protein LTR86_000100 [Recurvomyces mirabilis]